MLSRPIVSVSELLFLSSEGENETNVNTITEILKRVVVFQLEGTPVFL